MIFAESPLIRIGTLYWPLIEALRRERKIPILPRLQPSLRLMKIGSAVMTVAPRSIAEPAPPPARQGVATIHDP